MYGDCVWLAFNDSTLDNYCRHVQGLCVGSLKMK